jgi:hypothetical protein
MLAASRCGKCLQYGAYGLGEPDGKVPGGGERFGARNDAARSVERDRVGESTSRIQANPDFRFEAVRERTPSSTSPVPG